MAASERQTIEDLRAEFLDFCRVGKSLGDDDDKRCAQLAEVLKAHLKDKCNQLVHGANGQPLLFCYSCDATSFLCADVQQNASLGTSIVRKGKVLHEFLMQRGFCKIVHASGREQLEVLFADPLPLTEGKSCWNQFAAGSKFYPMLRQQGHRGICVFHLSADRAVLSGLTRMFRQRLRAYYSDEFGPPLGPEKPLLERSDLFVASGCAAHDIQNSLKWALASCGGPECLKDAHIVIESLRNSFSLLQARVRSFLLTRLAFDEAPFDIEEISAFWQNMGVEAHMVELLAEVNPWWHAGHLWVSAAIRDAPDMLDKVGAVMLYMFRWRRFVDTRWCTVGPACRAVLCSLCVGLEALVGATRADPKATDFHLHGFERLSPHVKRYMVVGGMTSFVSDALLAEVLADDRLARRPQELRQDLLAEIDWVESVGDLTWQRLAAVVGGGSDWRGLRAEVVAASHVCAAYIHRKVFDVLSGWPWKLLEGDLEDNLAALEASNDAPGDPFADGIRELLRAGCNREQVKAAVLLLRDAPWSTAPVEQSHGSCAVLHKFHPLYSGAQLAQRAMLHQCRHLFTTSAGDRALVRKADAVRKSQRSRRNRTSGRHEFFGFLMASVKDSLPEGAKMSETLRRTVMRQHSQLYQGLPPQDRASFDRLSVRRAEERAASDRGDTEYLKSALELALERQRVEEEAGGLTIRSTSVRFGDRDLAALSAMLRSPEFSKSQAKRLRETAALPPRIPPPEAIAALEACSPPPPAASRPAPAWLRSLCRNRDELRNSVLFTSDDDGSVAYLFCYATKSPLLAMFLSLRVRAMVLPCWDDCGPEEFEQAWQEWAEYAFEVVPGAYISHEELQLPEDAELQLVRDAFFKGPRSVVADGPAEPLSAWVCEKKEAKGDVSERRRPPTRSSLGDDLVAAHPWLEEYLHSSGGRSSGSRQGPHLPPAAVAANEVEVLTTEEMDAVWAALAAKREAWAAESVTAEGAFQTKIRGGSWTGSNKGREADCIAAMAVSGAPIEWCKAYGLNQMASFSYNLYGERVASTLAEEWCRRMLYFYGVWQAQPNPKYKFTSSDVEGYEESEEWKAFFTALPPGAARRRATGIRAVAPPMAA